MKKPTILKSIATFVLILVAGVAVKAQVTGTGALVSPVGSELKDTVTIGSVMPYQVSGDVNMHQLRNWGVLNASNYTKLISAGGTIHNSLGTGSPAASDSAFSVTWSSLGAQTVSVTEVPQVISGPAYCTANTETLDVVVINRPKAVWGTAPSSGCGVAGTTVSIPYTATGTGKFTVTYRIKYTTLTGTSTDVVNSNAVANLGNNSTGSQSLNFSYSVPAGAYGQYEVFIENISDRISRKSGVATIATTDYPVTALSFYAYPTPTTQPIRHIKNL